MQLKKMLLVNFIAFVMSVFIFNGVYAAPIHDAIAKGDLEAVRNLIANGADVNEKKSCCGCTPLMDAAYYGRLDIAELLIEKGADSNDTNKNGQTAMMISNNNNVIDVIKTIQRFSRTKSARK